MILMENNNIFLAIKTAILAVCKARQLDKLGLYTSVWADEEEEAA